MEQLLEKLMMSKKIMDKHNSMPRGHSPMNIPSSEIQSFDIPQAKYNIPQEFLQEDVNSQQSFMPLKENTKPVGTPTMEAIQKSKLPDEIKRLMIEHPIAQAQQPTMTLSDDLVEKASRLMKSESNNYAPESAKPKPKEVQTSSIDYGRIQKMIEQAVDKALEKNGLLVETAEKTNEIFSFKVGKHIFEGKVTKIKKLS